MTVLIDSDVLVRFTDSTHHDHLIALTCVMTLRSRGDRLVVATQNVAEYWNVATRRTDQRGVGRTPTEARVDIYSLTKYFERLPDTDSVFDIWLNLITDLNVSGKQVHDARLVAHMTVHNVDAIVTFNSRDFTRYPNIEVIKPTAE